MLRALALGLVLINLALLFWGMGRTGPAATASVPPAVPEGVPLRLLAEVPAPPECLWFGPLNDRIALADFRRRALEAGLEAEPRLQPEGVPALLLRSGQAALDARMRARLAQWADATDAALGPGPNDCVAPPLSIESPPPDSPDS